MGFWKVEKWAESGRRNDLLATCPSSPAAQAVYNYAQANLLYGELLRFSAPDFTVVSEAGALTAPVSIGSTAVHNIQT